MNARMPELKRCFEAAGFAHVRTILSSGNVAFDTRESPEAAIERQAEEAMQQCLGRSFYTIVRPSAYLSHLLSLDPYTRHGIPSHAKRVISFLRDERAPRVELPLAQDQASLFCLLGREAYTAYLATDKGPVFMRLIERAFGADVTTRTWDTVARCAAA